MLKNYVYNSKNNSSGIFLISNILWFFQKTVREGNPFRPITIEKPSLLQRIKFGYLTHPARYHQNKQEQLIIHILMFVYTILITLLFIKIFI